MPALLERPKLSNAMARALHRHIMMERERKRQEEEEVDKMMEQKMREEQERRRKKELEERMSLEETKEQIQKLQQKLTALQEEKHQLFLQLKKVLHEEEKRRRKEQNDMSTLTSAAYQQSMAVHTGTHLINMQGSPGGHNRPSTLMADRAKQMFGSQVMASRHYPGQPGFAPGTPEHGQYQTSQSSHSPYSVGQSPHGFGPGQAVPVSYASGQPIRGPSAFQAMQYLSHQPQAYSVHGHFTPTQPVVFAPDAPSSPSCYTDSAAWAPAHCADAANQGCTGVHTAGLSWELYSWDPAATGPHVRISARNPTGPSPSFSSTCPDAEVLPQVTTPRLGYKRPCAAVML
ncbi:G protein pathway suppressor 2 isoform X3 [Pleurodeles waltl]|uniref:G protein pathway suppressor 2 isoform X3 n=1 Tax=Pleurodeles waltl TaxID=8319 RepID=UPI0037099A8B